MAGSKNNFNNIEIGKFYGELNKRNKTISFGKKFNKTRDEQTP